MLFIRLNIKLKLTPLYLELFLKLFVSCLSPHKNLFAFPISVHPYILYNILESINLSKQRGALNLSLAEIIVECLRWILHILYEFV